MRSKYNPITIVQTVEKMSGVKDVRENEYHRIVVTFYDDATEQHRENVEEYMDHVAYAVHKESKHKTKFRSD